MLALLVDRYGIVKQVSSEFTALTGYASDYLLHKDWNRFIFSDEGYQQLEFTADSGEFEKKFYVMKEGGGFLSLFLVVTPDLVQGKHVGYSISIKGSNQECDSPIYFGESIKDNLGENNKDHRKEGSVLWVLWGACVSFLLASASLSAFGMVIEDPALQNLNLWLQWLLVGCGSLLALWLSMRVFKVFELNDPSSIENNNSYLEMKNLTNTSSCPNDHDDVILSSIEGVRKDLEYRLEEVNRSALSVMQDTDKFTHLHPAFRMVSKEVSDLMQRTTQATEDLNETLLKASREGGGFYLMEADALILSLEDALVKLNESMNSAMCHAERLIKIKSQLHGEFDPKGPGHSAIKPAKKDNVIPIRPLVSIHEFIKD